MGRSLANTILASAKLKTNTYGPAVDRSVPADSQQKAQSAASSVTSGSRRRANTAPGQQEFAPGDPGFEASRLQNAAKKNADRAMYGSAPPVSIEVNEKIRQDALKASAIAMAKKMYAIQQAQINDAKSAQRSGLKGHRRGTSDVSGDDSASSTQFIGLEEQARKLAQERLARMRDENQEFRDYYGQYSPPKQGRTMSQRLRRRNTSDADIDEADEENSRKIRSQMSMFRNNVAEIDAKKRQSDREAVLAAAYKNVSAKMLAMDEKVFMETGKAICTFTTVSLTFYR